MTIGEERGVQPLPCFPWFKTFLTEFLTRSGSCVLVLFVNDAAEMGERHGRILARLSELGLSLAESVHGQALAAEDPKATAELGLAFHRISRTVRQSIALEARLVHDARRAERQALEDTERARNAQPRDSVRILQRKQAVQAAVERVIWDEREGQEAEDLLDRLEEWIEVAALSNDFGLEPLDAHVARLCADLGLKAGDVAGDDDDAEDGDGEFGPPEFDAPPTPADST